MELQTLRGSVVRIFFANPESPFMAGVLALEDGTQIRFNAKCAASQGDILELTGAWAEHPKYGSQFEAQTGVVRMDETPEALIHLLATREEFEGIGPARAKKIVEAALRLSGDGDLGVALQEYAKEISDQSGVRIELVENAANHWNGRKEEFACLAVLCEQGWSNAQAQKIFYKYGISSPSIVKDDPYQLIGKITRFGWRTVDGIALQLGIEKMDPMRIAACIAFCFDKIAQDGNTYTDRDGLITEVMMELKPDTLDAEDKIYKSLQGMIESGLVFADVSPHDSEIVADASLSRVEIEVFQRLIMGLSSSAGEDINLSGPSAASIYQSLNDGQQEAVRGFSNSRFSVISGGAGVGKTYTMRAICAVSEESGLKVGLCAPTGKAARKLSHATSRTAKTIHRLLAPKFDQESGGFVFTHSARNPLSFDLVIIDEISMVDVRLMRSLLSALKDGARLLMVGDHHQIPSVGPGAILRDLLAAKSHYPHAVHVLTTVVRQAGILARNTSAVLDGMVVQVETPDWRVRRTEKGNKEGVAALIAMDVERLVTADVPLEPFGRPLDLAWDVQVLAPMRKRDLGTYKLNVHLQKLRQRLLGNPAPEETPKDKPPKPMVGDRVIWTKNDYELDLLNGTQAIVVGLPKGGAMEIYTEDGREVTVPGGKRTHVEVAYAMTIHKAQGSEWPCVILVASSSHHFMHDRNLLYTGASRASEALVVTGDAGGMNSFAEKQKSAERKTLGSFLVHGWSPGQAPHAGHEFDHSTSPVVSGNAEDLITDYDG